MKSATQIVKTIATGLIAGLALAAPLHAQTEPIKSMPAKSSTDAMNTGHKMGGMMQMDGMMQKMQADTKAMDDELDGLVVTMNQATGSDKKMPPITTPSMKAPPMVNPSMAMPQSK